MFCHIYAGLNINEVAHDMNVPLTKRIIEQGYINSYDTWHGRHAQYNII
jgi:hypothetical protein